MSDRQQLRNLALEMMQAGSAMMKSGSETLAEFTGDPPPDVHTRVRNELASAALTVRGLGIDRIPQKRRYELFLRGENAPYVVMDDDEIMRWADKGPGALLLKIESDFTEELKGRDKLEDRTTSKGQEQGPRIREGGDSGESF